jgi:serum/glucocorticoid-regulated kinase 2
LLKVIKKASLTERDIQNTIAEKEIMRVQKNPFLARLKFSFKSERRLYLGMDFFSGNDLNHHRKNLGRLNEPAVVYYARELCLALAHLHSRNIAHRDMKPHNCMIGADGHIRLCDFGLAKEIAFDDRGRQRTYSVVGTPKYVAPEILTTQHRSEGYGFSVDWWSWGVTLFEALTGSNPFVDSGSDKAKVFNNITY